MISYNRQKEVVRLIIICIGLYASYAAFADMTDRLLALFLTCVVIALCNKIATELNLMMAAKRK